LELNLKIKNPNNDPLLEAITNNIRDKYKCHTVILYGSHARNAATPTSDYDIICIRAKGDLERDFRLFKGFYLNAILNFVSGGILDQKKVSSGLRTMTHQHIVPLKPH
jgi:predicted nucleotidyltransferase